MSTILNLFYVASGAAALYYGAEFLVRGGVRIAEKCRISPLVIGLTLVAFATSAPELVVSIDAAIHGNADICLGNAVGSNICNIALILGCCAVITPLQVNVHLFRFDAPVMLLAAVMLAVFFLTGHGINRIHGTIFFSAIILYTIWSIRQAKREAASDVALDEVAQKSVLPEKGRAMRLSVAIFLVLLGFALLVLGARFFLDGSVFFARLLQVSDAVIGLTLVAFGTCLPELATSIVAALRGEKDIAIGNVVGSNIFNIFANLGIAPLISPLRNATLSNVDLGALLFCSALLLPIMRTGWRISRLEGVFLLLTYCAYTAWLVMQSAL